MGKKIKKRYKFYRKKSRREKESSLPGILITFLAIFVLVYGFSFVKRLGQKEIEEIIDPKDIRIQILNGSGIKGVSGEAAGILDQKESKNFIFYVVDEGDFSDSFVSQTILLDRTGNEELIEEIAKTLGIKKSNVLFKPLRDNYLDLDATLVLGPDFKSYLEKVGKK